ncbi:MAG TPA: carboxypeptidase-like regulatory domain-containing protein, partial [Terriglobales bacterium]|nr:carboxypeptidase-like regulatory domain-containing protein [Terriglobales bacterium]
ATIIISAALAASSPLFAQTAKPPAAGGRISGTVVHATNGQPLAGVDVAISPTEQRDQVTEATTGLDGRFVFENVARGKFSLSAQGRGFSEQAYQQHAPYSTAVAVGPGLISENLTFQLVPDASISGSVMDEENEAVRDGEVLLFARDGATGRMELRARENLENQGRYRFGHLSPGTYFVAVSAQPWYATDPATAPNAAPLSMEGEPPASQSAVPTSTGADSSLDVTYRVTFYADAVEAEGATPISLHPGEHATADITMRAVPAVHLTLRNASTDPNQPGSVAVQERVYTRTLVPIPVRAQPAGLGILKVSGVPPGHLVLNLRTFTGKAWKNEEREIEISSDTEVDAADISPAAVFIHGKVEISGESAFPTGTYIRFFNLDTNETFGTAVSTNGKFEVSQTVARTDSYEIIVQNDRRTLVQTIRATGAKVVGRTVVLPRTGTVELEITLSAESARIDGTVLHEEKGLSQAMVVLVPESPQGNADLIRRDQSDSDGTFTLYQVLPGRYTVVAIENGWELDWQNPAVLRPYVEHGERIEVTGARTYKISVSAQNASKSSSGNSHAEN